MNIALASTFFVLFILFIILSIAIWKFEKLNIINGYNPNKVKDKEGYAKFIGVSYIIMAVLQLIISILVLFSNYMAIVIPGGIFLILIIIMIPLSKKYEI